MKTLISNEKLRSQGWVIHNYGKIQWMWNVRILSTEILIHHTKQVSERLVDSFDWISSGYRDRISRVCNWLEVGDPEQSINNWKLMMEDIFGEEEFDFSLQGETDDDY